MVGESADVDGDDELEGCSRSDAGHGERASVRVVAPSVAAMCALSASASSMDSRIRLASVMICGLSASIMHTGGLAEGHDAFRAVSILALSEPLATAPMDAFLASTTTLGSLSSSIFMR